MGLNNSIFIDNINPMHTDTSYPYGNEYFVTNIKEEDGLIFAGKYELQEEANPRALARQELNDVKQKFEKIRRKNLK